MISEIPTIDEVSAARGRLERYVVETPVWRWQSPDLEKMLGFGTDVVLKLELFQRTGTFKPRGALTVMLHLDQASLKKGVTAVSAGNHAIAVAYASKILGTSAKVVMPKTANVFRVRLCQEYGADVILADDVQEAFARVEQLQKEEGRTFVHPFEGPLTALGNATLGLELHRQVSGLDAVVVPVGGGGLIAGVSLASKQLAPTCQVFGVEPTGADTMTRSLRAGKPQAIEQVRTMADSLGAPHAAPYSFALCQRYVDDVVLVDDDELRRAMGLLFRSMKLAVEPAGAAAVAALLGPLRERLEGKRVGLIVCGANIDIASFAQAVAAAGE